MISCISPNAGSCEHTLNTLRYADRVKSLSRSGNPRRDQAGNPLPPSNKDASSASSLLATADAEDVFEQQQEVKFAHMGRKIVEKDVYAADFNKQPSKFSSSYPFNGREESGKASGPVDRDRFEVNGNYGGSTSQRVYSSNSQYSADTEEKVPKVSPPRRKATREEKPEKMRNMAKKDGGSSDLSTSNSRQPNAVNNYEANNFGYREYDPEPSADDTEEKVTKVSPPRRKTREEKPEKLRNMAKKDGGGSDSVNNYETSNVGYRQYDPEPPTDENINAILEEEEALIASHRKEIEDTMEIVREEMKLLAEVDQPGSHIDNYVTQLSFVLSRKAASLVSLQARLSRFQHRLKEKEILSRKRVPR
ncbi:ubiquitin-like-specific protease ESD4-like [Hibiscus syriacus]|uniref:Ubiquitin-like-specific protease ESD4-like n=2 Tax=Hibiscus syriacus TaxID=106335 RepID=A0A6A3D4I4_HIBSY|nr:ubiquitin-like-specific protease ESD4-like [Hibiscus syriacus]